MKKCGTAKLKKGSPRPANQKTGSKSKKNFFKKSK